MVKTNQFGVISFYHCWVRAVTNDGYLSENLSFFRSNQQIKN